MVNAKAFAELRKLFMETASMRDISIYIRLMELDLAKESVAFMLAVLKK